MNEQLRAVPLELKEAQAYIHRYHRHHEAAHRDKFRIGCMKGEELVGVVQVGRPVNRHMDDGKTLEVLRLCSTGSRNVCSFLYSRAARVARELGYTKIITYILDEETGASLKASGWKKEEDGVGGGSWDTPARPRELGATQLSLFPEKQKYPTGKKQRWAKCLNEKEVN